MRVDYIESGSADICRPILQSVHRWFGIESINEAYIQYVDEHPTFIAYEDDMPIGFLSLKRHYAQAVEIWVIAVHVDYHRRGVGRALLDSTEAMLREEGVKFLQVKTLNDTHPSPEFALTREFYKGMGFVPLEVFPTIWSEDHPALQLIKVL